MGFAKLNLGVLYYIQLCIELRSLSVYNQGLTKTKNLGQKGLVIRSLMCFRQIKAKPIFMVYARYR